MTQQPQQYPSKPLHSVTLPFLGMELSKQGTTKTGKPYSLYKLKFDVQREYPFTVGVFDKLSDKGVAIDKLVIGTVYKVLYTEEPSPAGKGYRRNGIMVSVPPTPQIVLPRQPQTQHHQPQHHTVQQGTGVIPTNQPRLALQWVEFKDAYLSEFRESPLVDPRHMLGVYVATMCEQEFKDIILLCEKTLKVHSHETEQSPEA